MKMFYTPISIKEIMSEISKIDGLLDGNGFVSVELTSPQVLPPEKDGTFHTDRTLDYLIAKAARASTGLELKTPKTDRSLIRYLVKNRHTSPTEMPSMTFLVKCPISIGRQFLRHRTAKINEFSQRYSDVTEEMGRFDLRTPSCWRGQSKMNAQSSVELEEEKKAAIAAKLEEVEAKLDDLFRDYQTLGELGLTREVRRFLLPQSTYTMFYYQMDLNNLMKFLSLRMAPDAQEEIRVYANAMFELTKIYFPVTMEIFEEEMKNMTLSVNAQEMIRTRKIPDGVTSKSERAHLEEIAANLNIDLI